MITITDVDALRAKLRWYEAYVKELEGLVRDMSPLHCDEWLTHCSDEATKETSDDE